MSQKRTPYKMYHPEKQVTALDTHGQSWDGETVEENIGLCRHQLIEPLFQQYLPREGKILESGCGLGRWVFYLQKLGFNIIGIDIAAEALKRAKEYDPDAPIYAESVLQSSFPDESFDAVISLGVLEHFEEGPEAGIREAHRLLKNNGLFFVTVPLQNTNRLFVANFLKEFKRWLMKRKGVSYVFEEYRFTRAEFENKLEGAHFEIITVATDDFKPPKNMGLYVDYPFLRHKTNKWELNKAGKFLYSILNSISPWICPAGIIWICRKKS